MGTNAPPVSSNASEITRVEHTRTRRQILYGQHEELVRDRLVRAVGTTRANAVRIVDMSVNPAWYVCSQLSALYRQIPEVAPPDGAEDTAAAIAEAGYWQLAQRVQRDTIGLNDCFVRVDLDRDNENAPSFRIVFPDLVEVVSSPLAPAQPLAMKEWIQDPDDPLAWVCLHTDPRSRVYRALDAEGRDISERVLGGKDFSGENYPFMADGRAVLPYTAYHAAESGFTLDPLSGREVFDGALQLGVYYSFFGHCLRQASWGQRWIAGMKPVGGDLDESGRRRDVVADPATVLMLEQSDEGNGTGQAGQWSAPVSPDAFIGSIERYERRLVEMALGNVGVSRRESDVRSAMSLAVSREAQREAQAAYEPVFRRSDMRLLKLVAGLRGEPMNGWRINYRSIPRDAAELAAEVDRIEKLIRMGMLDRVSAYQQLHPALTDAEAVAALQQIDARNRLVQPAPQAA